MPPEKGREREKKRDKEMHIKIYSNFIPEIFLSIFNISVESLKSALEKLPSILIHILIYSLQKQCKVLQLPIILLYSKKIIFGLFSVFTQVIKKKKNSIVLFLCGNSVIIQYTVKTVILFFYLNGKKNLGHCMLFQVGRETGEERNHFRITDRQSWW